MKLSVITPSHRPKHLDAAWESIRSQADGLDMEWIVALNGGARYRNDDPRVKIVKAPIKCGGKVGALKKFAFEESTGDVLIELDHDDILLPNALSSIAGAANECDRAFFYSDTLETKNGESVAYDGKFGWEHYEHQHDGVIYKINAAFDPSPRSLAEIFYAPNHVRAWTRKAYEESGGHDASMSICDDQDLVIRTFLSGADFIHFDVPLYWQKLDGGNTQSSRNAEIQKMQARVRDKYILELAIQWSLRNKLMALDFGGAHGGCPGLTPVDRYKVEGGIQCDLSSFPLPFEDQSVGVIRCQDFLEHIPIGKVVPLMNEIHRVLAHNGILWTSTPSTDGRGAFCDPTHVSFWNELSFRYYTAQQFARFVPEIRTKFQQVSLETLFPNDFHRQQNIPYVKAVLCALHGQRVAGLIHYENYRTS